RGGLLRADLVRLRPDVAVEDGAHGLEVVILDEVDRFPDLTLARLTVADDAEDPLVEAVDLRRRGEAGGVAEALAERPGGGVKEREALDRVGVAVDDRVDGAERHRVVAGHGASLA